MKKHSEPGFFASFSSEKGQESIERLKQKASCYDLSQVYWLIHLDVSIEILDRYGIG